MKILYLMLFATGLFNIASCREEIAHRQGRTPLKEPFDSSLKWTSTDKVPVSANVKLFGKIVSANHARARIYPLFDGAVARVTVSLGDIVKKGQLLAVLRTSRFADLEKERMDAVTEISTAVKNLQVAGELFEGKLNTERDVLVARNELQRANAALRRVNETYATLNQKAGTDFSIVAPMAGFIVEKNINENMQISADKMETVFSIARIDTVWVLANVNESDVEKIRLGMEADVQTLSYPGRRFTGHVDRVFNFLDPETRAMQIRISIPNPDLLLKPEMSTTVLVKYKESREMVAVPASALIFDESKYWVLVKKPGARAEIRQVGIYRETDDTVYLETGLQPGEIILASDQLLLYNQLKK